MTGQITDKEFMKKGFSAMDEFLEESEGVIVTVEGKQKYIILSVEEYNHLRKYELKAAIVDAPVETL